MKSSVSVALTSLLFAFAASCASMDEPEGLAPVDDEQAAVEELDLSPEDRAALDAFGQQCGSVVCTGRTHCCNASCSKCVPFGMECTQEACLTGEAGEKSAPTSKASAGESEAVFAIGEQCGPVVCSGATPTCCNANCGICVVKGGSCPQDYEC